MRSFRSLCYAVLLGWIAVLARPVVADDPVSDRMKPGHCGCDEGKACWHYLRTPLRPPEDPCRCGMCAAKGDCSSKERPAGWSGECMGSQRPPCFWKRHAASWGLTCSECLADTECPSCNEVAHLPNAEAATQARKQVALEGDSPKRPMVVGWSEHFYMATDVARLKLLTQGGAPRVADQHEILHLFLERAEKAYDDFVAVWGPIGTPGRTGFFLADKKSKMEGWQASYFGSAKTNMMYGAAAVGTGRIGGGFCVNGFATSIDEFGNDRDLHAYERHMIGHILFSMWHAVKFDAKRCPKWAFAGVADWLSKIDPLFVDWTVFCFDEGQGTQGSGKDWDTKARAIAAGRRDPIEKLFGIASESHMTTDDHIRSWSYMDVMLREDRERWLAVLRAIRDGKEAAAAFQEGLGMSPDEFDKRWADRVLGKRKSMVDVPKDARMDPDGPLATARRRIQAEQDPAVLAALIRGLDRVGDVKTAEVVLGRLVLDSDLIRETVVMLLTKTTAPEVVAWMRSTGLTSPDSLTRAHVCRVLGNLKDAAARPTLETLLDDAHWLVRANAARALYDIADPASAAVLVAKIEDANPKAFIAKADALASFGAVTSKATPALVKRLEASDWQVRLTACRALAIMGDKDAVDPLIERLDTEGGRLRKEILAALRGVTHETFGENAQTWRDWWKRQKPRGIPQDLPPPVKPEDERYAKPKPIRPEEPTYYGRRLFSASLLFVLDLSKSMETLIRVPEDAQKRLGTLPAGQRIAIAKGAAMSAIAKLDPRARFNIVFFSTLVRPWQKSLVVAAGMREQAEAAIQSAALEDETNIYGALRAAVGLHERPTLSADLDPIPDTIYFLTDGTPTRGEITDPETILSWMRDVNRFAKVELHVIAMGNTGVDLEFLRKLAEENHGEFIHVPDTDFATDPKPPGMPTLPGMK